MAEGGYERVDPFAILAHDSPPSWVWILFGVLAGLLAAWVYHKRDK